MIHRIRNLLQTEYAKTLPENKKIRNASISLVAGKILIIFFAIMLLFTIVSRASESITIARVKVENPRRDKLNYTVTGTGKISMAEEEYLNVIPGYRIDKVYVSSGELVTTETILFRYSEEELQEKYVSIENAMNKIQIQIQLEQLTSASSTQVTTQAPLLSLMQAEDRLRIARMNLFEAETDKSAKEAVRIAEQAVETYTLQYELAEQNDTDRILSNEINSKILELTLQGYNIDLLEKEKELEVVKNLLESSGEITSPYEGIVSSIGLVEGKTTIGEELIKIGVGDYLFKAVFDKEKAENVEVGSKVKVTLAGKESGITTEINKITINEDGMSELTATLPEKDYLVGEIANYKATSQSELFELCVPIQALRTGDSGYYVLVLKEQEDILGTEMIATLVSVIIIDKDNSTVAVEGALSQNDNVITESSKYIKAGDKVRIN